MMKLLNYICNLYFNWQGKINRYEYLFSLLVLLSLSFLLIQKLGFDKPLSLFIYLIFFLYCYSCFNIKRLRDFGKKSTVSTCMFIFSTSLFLPYFVIPILFILPSNNYSKEKLQELSSFSEVKVFKSTSSKFLYLNGFTRFLNPYNISWGDFIRTEELAMKDYALLALTNNILIVFSLLYMRRVSNFLKIYFFYQLLIYVILDILIQINTLGDLGNLIVAFFCLCFNFSEQIFCINQARKRLKYCRQILETEQYQELEDGTWLGTVKDFKDIQVKEFSIDECRKELKKAVEYEIFSQLYHGTLVLT